MMPGAPIDEYTVPRRGLAIALSIIGLSLWLESYGRNPPPGGLPLFWQIMPFVTWPLVAISLHRFFQANGHLYWGVGAMLGMKALFERFALVSEVQRQNYQQSGVVLLGWVLGRAIARLAYGKPKDEADWRVHHSLGYRTALALFAASYASAGLSKVRLGGVDWLQSPVVRMMIVSHTATEDGMGVSALRAFIANSPLLCSALQVGTVAIEVGALCMLFGPRARVLTALALFGMHVGITVASGIIFPQPVVMALLLCLPWHQWIAKWRLRRLTTSVPAALAIFVLLPVCMTGSAGCSRNHPDAAARIELLPPGAPGPLDGTWVNEFVPITCSKNGVGPPLPEATHHLTLIFKGNSYNETEKEKGDCRKLTAGTVAWPGPGLISATQTLEKCVGTCGRGYGCNTAERIGTATLSGTYKLDGKNLTITFTNAGCSCETEGCHPPQHDVEVNPFVRQ